MAAVRKALPQNKLMRWKRQVATVACGKLKSTMLGAGLLSILFIPNFVKIGQLIKKLDGRKQGRHKKEKKVKALLCIAPSWRIVEVELRFKIF
jgi:hypothetical protein